MEEQASKSSENFRSFQADNGGILTLEDRGENSVVVSLLFGPLTTDGKRIKVGVTMPKGALRALLDINPTPEKEAS